MSSLPERLEKALAVAGIILILGPIFLVENLTLQVGIVVVGILMIEAGVWGLARNILPDGRTYLRLREETEIFLEQVRALNEAAVEEEEQAVERQRQRMKEQVDRLVDAAGVEG